MENKLPSKQLRKKTYVKHLNRLACIYDKQKMKERVKLSARKIDHLMSKTHRSHLAAQTFRVNYLKQIQKQTQVRDISIMNTSMRQYHSVNSLVKTNWKINRRQNKQNQIVKQNMDFVVRLMKVRPTIPLIKKSKLDNNNSLSKKASDCDFTQILNSSQILTKKNIKKISLRLNKCLNSCVIKLGFPQQISSILKSQKIYLFTIKNLKNQTIQSQCFNLKELIQSQVCIYKRQEDQIKNLQLRQLVANDNKSLYKGTFRLHKVQEILYSNSHLKMLEVHIQFQLYGRSILTLLLMLSRKNIKSHKKLILKTPIIQTTELKAQQLDTYK